MKPFSLHRYLLFACCATSAQTKNRRFGILFWYMAPGLTVPAGKACTTFLSGTATTSALFKSR